MGITERNLQFRQHGGLERAPLDDLDLEALWPLHYLDGEYLPDRNNKVLSNHLGLAGTNVFAVKQYFEEDLCFVDGTPPVELPVVVDVRVLGEYAN